MSVYDTIREGIQDDWRKAREYDALKVDMEAKIADALANPDKDAWRHGFDTGYEFARRLYRGERPLNDKEAWEKFRALRMNNRETEK